MTPTLTPLLGGIEQIFLLMFLFMILVGIAGGNPSMVLTPVFDIVGRLAGMILSLLSTLITRVFQFGLTLLTSGLKGMLTVITEGASRRTNRKKRSNVRTTEIKPIQIQLSP